MASKSNIWITPHKDGWAIKREGGKKSSLVVDTKKAPTKPE